MIKLDIVAADVLGLSVGSVGSVHNVCSLDTVTNALEYGSALLKLHGLFVVGSHTNSVDDSVTGNEDFAVGDLNGLVIEVDGQLLLLNHILNSTLVVVVAAIGDIAEHLNDLYLVAVLHQVECQLYADKACAENDDLALGEVEVVVNIDGLMYVCTADAGDLGNNGLGANSSDDNITVFLGSILGSDFGVETNVNIGVLQIAYLLCDVLMQSLLEGNISLAQDSAAQLTGLFAQNDLVAVLGSGEGCLHTGDTAADDHNSLLLCLGQGVICHSLTADFGVDGAVEVTGVHALTVAVEAAHALTDLVNLAGPDLVGEVGIADELTCHVNDVSLAGSEDLFHVVGIAQAAKGTNQGLLDVLLDLGCVLNVDALGIEHADVGTGMSLGGAPYATNGYVDNVSVAVELLSDTASFFDAVAVFNDLRTADTDLNGEILTANSVDLIDSHNSQTAAALGVAAPAVGTGVHIRGHELLQTPAVSAVEGDHAEAGLLCSQSGLAEALDDFLETLLSHSLDLAAHVVVHVNGAPGGLILADVSAQTGLGSGELKLYYRHCAVTGNGACKTGEVIVIASVDVSGPAAAAGLIGVYVDLTGADGGSAAHGLALEVHNSLNTGLAGVQYIGMTGRCTEHSVTENNITDLNG